MVRVTNINAARQARQIHATGQWVGYGETVEVDADLAGHPPKGTPGDDEFDPGSGLLAQTEVWATPRRRAAQTAAEHSDEAPPTPAADNTADNADEEAK